MSENEWWGRVLGGARGNLKKSDLYFCFFSTDWDVTLEPCVHAPLPFEPNTFLAFTHLPLPPGLSDSAARSSIRLTLVA